MCKVVVTIPAYNEIWTIGEVIKDIKAQGFHNILVLDDGSVDDTAKIAKRFGAIVHRNKRNLGLAKTFQIEMKKCLEMGADIIVHTDADGQYPAKHIKEMVEEVKKGNDLVLGSRFGNGNYSGSKMKKMGNIIFAKVFSKLLNMNINDTTTGFRAFNKDVAKISIINNFTYTQEQIIRVAKEGMGIKEIPIETNETRESKLFKSPIDYAIKAWINLFRIFRDYNPLKFFGIIGLSFMIPGILIGFRLFYWYISVGHIYGRVPSAILSVLFLLMGLQIIIFGFVADKK